MKPGVAWGSSRRRRFEAAGLRNERGAIVLMAGVFIVMIMIFAAILVDAGRIFAARNELQTASDAAALAGALQLLEDSTTADDTVRVYAQRNRVEADGVDSVEIEYGVWRPADQVFVLGGEPRDAVRVITRHPLPLSLARVFGDSTVMLSATAIAWSAGPVMEPECLKPLAVPYSRLLQILDYPRWADVQLSDDDIRRLREMPVADRRWHFHYGNQANEDEDYPQYGEDHFRVDQYFPIDIDSTWNRNDANMLLRPSLDPATYREYLAGPPEGRCTERVRSGDPVRSEPGDKMDALRNGLSDICQAKGGTLEGTSTLRCVANGDRIEMQLRVVYWSATNPNPEFPVWFDNGQRSRLVSRMTGSFVVQEVDWDGDNATHGRMWGYFDVQSAFGVVDETIASTLFRPVLVR
jgi:hypothetical protein